MCDPSGVFEHAAFAAQRGPPHGTPPSPCARAAPGAAPRPAGGAAFIGARVAQLVGNSRAGFFVLRYFRVRGTFGTQNVPVISDFRHYPDTIPALPQGPFYLENKRKHRKRSARRQPKHRALPLMTKVGNIRVKNFSCLEIFRVVKYSAIRNLRRLTTLNISNFRVY